LKAVIVIGIILTVAGAIGLAYGWFAYGSQMTDAVSIPWVPIAGGGGSVAIGMALVIAGVMRSLGIGKTNQP
jgi:hypothetical protein